MGMVKGKLASGSGSSLRLLQFFIPGLKNIFLYISIEENMSDTSSVSSSHSTMSVSLSKMECPYCNKDLQVRGMFAHIRKFHNVELLKNTNRRWLDEASAGNPLRVWWTKKNDFDEDEETILYVCLSTNKTFTSAMKAQAHFQKDKDALKDHNKQLKQLRKDFETMKKADNKKKKQEANTDPYILRRNNAFNNNDPELAHAIWRGILNSKKVCECALVICKRRGYKPDTPMYLWDKYHKMFEEIKFSDFIVHHEKLMTKIETLIQAKCLDVMLLHKIYMEVLCFWLQNYKESIMAFHEDMKELHPIYNCIAEEKYYNYATEEMEGVVF